MDSTYKPIDCDFHDELEARATTGKRCDIVYQDENGQKQTVHGVIQDVFTHEHQEYIRLRQGTVIRLDLIESVDGLKLRKPNVEAEIM